MWFCFEVKWSEVKWREEEVSYGEVLGDKSTMYIRVTLYLGYLLYCPDAVTVSLPAENFQAV